MRSSPLLAFTRAKADRETYISLGFNTNHIPAAEAPKRLNDLLDPKWKGKMSLAGGATAARWVGAVRDRDRGKRIHRETCRPGEFRC